MPSSDMAHRVDLVRTDVPEDRIASIIKMKKINELGILTSVASYC
jgi:hypothetical protein